MPMRAAILPKPPTLIPAAFASRIAYGNYWDDSADAELGVTDDWGIGDCEANPEWISMANGAAPGSVWLNGGLFLPADSTGLTNVGLIATVNVNICTFPEVWTGDGCDVPAVVNQGFVIDMEQLLGSISVGVKFTFNVGDPITTGTLQGGGAVTIDSTSGVTTTTNNSLRLRLPRLGRLAVSTSGTVTGSTPVVPSGGTIGSPGVFVGVTVNGCGQVGNNVSLSFPGYISVGAGFYVNLGCCRSLQCLVLIKKKLGAFGSAFLSAAW